MKNSQFNKIKYSKISSLIENKYKNFTYFKDPKWGNVYGEILSNYFTFKFTASNEDIMNGLQKNKDIIKELITKNANYSDNFIEEFQ